jgi:chromosomal replication initiator protein
VSVIEEIERRRMALNAAVVEADRLLRPALAEVRARLASLEEILSPDSRARRRIHMSEMLATVAATADLEPPDIKGLSRDIEVRRARKAFIWLVREVTDHSWASIGRVLSNRDHTTIISGHRSAIKLRKADEDFRDWTDRLRFIFTGTKEGSQCPE